MAASVLVAAVKMQLNLSWLKLKALQASWSGLAPAHAVHSAAQSSLVAMVMMPPRKCGFRILPTVGPSYRIPLGGGGGGGSSRVKVERVQNETKVARISIHHLNIILVYNKHKKPGMVHNVCMPACSSAYH